MAEPFEKSAKYYDLFSTPEDNYESEINFIEHCFENFSDDKITKVLDCGCGTGMYSIPLAKRRYKVTGVDINTNMLEVAKIKAEDQKLKLNFHHQDIRKLSFFEEFDATICMNSTLNYIISTEDVIKTLKGFYNSLKSGGILYIDIFNFLIYYRYNFKPVLLMKNKPESLSISKILINETNSTSSYRRIGIIDEKKEKLRGYVEDFNYRIYTKNDMVALLKKAGFKDIHFFVRTTEDKLLTPSRFVFVCKKT